MAIILFDDETRYQLLPFTHTRSIADIRCGIMTMRERWEHFFKQESGTLTVEHIQEVYPTKVSSNNLYINGGIFATQELYEKIETLQPNQQLVKDELLIAAHFSDAEITFKDVISISSDIASIQYTGDITRLKNNWDIFKLNGNSINKDFALLTTGRHSQNIPEDVTVRGAENVFVEEGASIAAGCIINATTGPIYIGKGAEILEGVLMRGPVALCDNAVLKMGAKIYADTTIGTGCKIGGENSNVVYFANSNKGHDGYLGNAVIGEWCNLGADTNCSNLKNNYGTIKIWDEHNNKSIQTGEIFCGLLMGDHSKCGINTMFNTGTVVGVSANIYGSNFPEKFIPSFTWGGSEGMTTYRLDRALETADRMMGRRKKALTEQERKMYQYIFDNTQSQRDIFANG